MTKCAGKILRIFCGLRFIISVDRVGWAFELDKQIPTCEVISQKQIGALICTFSCELLFYEVLDGAPSGLIRGHHGVLSTKHPEIPFQGLVNLLF